MSGSSLPLSWAETLLPFVSLLGVLLFYGTLALLLSMLLPARRLAAMAAGMLLVASYFITALAQINSALKPIAWFSPLEYYQSGHAIRGLKLTWLVGLLAVSALFTGPGRAGVSSVATFGKSAARAASALAVAKAEASGVTHYDPARRNLCGRFRAGRTAVPRKRHPREEGVWGFPGRNAALLSERLILQYV